MENVTERKRENYIRRDLKRLNEAFEIAWTTDLSISVIAKLVGLRVSTVRTYLDSRLPFKLKDMRRLGKHDTCTGPECESLEICLKTEEYKRYLKLKTMRDLGYFPNGSDQFGNIVWRGRENEL